MTPRHLLLDNLLATLAYLGLESHTLVHYYCFLNDQVFLLKEPPVLLEKFEATLNCLYIFACHSKLIMFNEEANSVSTIYCILIVLRIVALASNIIVKIIVILLINLVFTRVVRIALTANI